MDHNPSNPPTNRMITLTFHSTQIEFLRMFLEGALAEMKTQVTVAKSEDLATQLAFSILGVIIVQLRQALERANEKS